MSHHFISVQIAPGVFKHFEVSKEVSIYIAQLENAIRFPELSKIKEVYKDRFGDTKFSDPIYNPVS